MLTFESALINREAEDMVEEVTMITDADVHHHAGNFYRSGNLYE